MSFQDQWIEELNYRNDHRTRAAEADRFKFDEKRMVAILPAIDPETEEPFEEPLGAGEAVEVPVTFEVCSTCDGKGSHVDPSIDASGFCPEDADDTEAYFSGAYDVPCYGCGGKRVEPVLPDPDKEGLTEEQRAALKGRLDALRYEAEFAAEREAERRFGC